MSAILQALADILEQETALHSQLLAAAETKRAAIIQGDLPAMETLLAKEQALIAEVERAEVERQRLAAEARRLLQLSEDARLSEMIARAPEAEGRQLAAVREKLQGILDKLRQRTRQNGELLRASIQHIEGFLRTVLEAADPHPHYDSAGRRATGPFRLFDRSA